MHKSMDETRHHTTHRIDDPMFERLDIVETGSGDGVEARGERAHSAGNGRGGTRGHRSLHRLGPRWVVTALSWRPSRRASVFGLLLLLAAVVSIQGPFEVETLLQLGSRVAARPWFMLGAVLLMAVMTTIGLPGSVCLWLVAPFHPPWLATILLTIGGVGGAAGAYSFSSWLRSGWNPGRVGRKVMRLLSRQSDMLTQIALRVLPGFPHQIVNFGAGVLRLSRRRFLLAATIGLIMKWMVYASAVYGVTEAVSAGKVLHPGVLLPLAALTALLLTGALVRRRLATR